MKSVRSAFWDFLTVVVLCLLFIAVLSRNIYIPVLTLFANALYLVNFIIHEIGHVLFSIFGQFVGVLGGTLTQILFPTLVLIIVAIRNKRLQTAFFTFWFGESLTEVSIYIRDARSQLLRLVSPFALFNAEKPLHDWHYLLGEMNLLWADQLIGMTIAAIGFFVMCAAIVIILMPWIAALHISKKKPGA